MVWFQCEVCGENLKKPKLPNHFNRCSAYKLSCIDCGVVFDQQSVLFHTSCVTEVQKYGPKGHNANGAPSNKAKNGKEVSGGSVDISRGLSTRPPWFCSLCNVNATSRETLELHSQGKKHRGKAKAAAQAEAKTVGGGAAESEAVRVADAGPSTAADRKTAKDSSQGADVKLGASTAADKKREKDPLDGADVKLGDLIAAEKKSEKDASNGAEVKLGASAAAEKKREKDPSDGADVKSGASTVADGKREKDPLDKVDVKLRASNVADKKRKKNLSDGGDEKVTNLGKKVKSTTAVEAGTRLHSLGESENIDKLEQGKKKVSRTPKRKDPTRQRKGEEVRLEGNHTESVGHSEQGTRDKRRRQSEELICNVDMQGRQSKGQEARVEDDGKQVESQEKLRLKSTKRHKKSKSEKDDSLCHEVSFREWLGDNGTPAHPRQESPRATGETPELLVDKPRTDPDHCRIGKVVKWKKIIRGVLGKALHGRLKKKDFKKVALPLAQKAVEESSALSVDKKHLKAELMRQVNSSDKFLVDGKHVMLAPVVT